MLDAKTFLVDTNVLIDYCDVMRPQHADAVELVRAAARGDAYELVALVSSLKDLYFIMARQLHDEAAARELVRIVSQVFRIVDLKELYSTMALASDEPDYEDGLVRAAAEVLGARGIVSRDVRAFAASHVPRLSAAQAVARIAGDVPYGW